MLGTELVEIMEGEQGMSTIQVPTIFGGIAADFMEEWWFADAYMSGYSTLANLGERGALFQYDAWRVRIALWAAAQAAKLPGDFVECGVNTGFLARAIVHHLKFAALPKRFYLVDTFSGVPADQLSPEEKAAGREEHLADLYNEDVYDICKGNFASFKNVIVVKGRVPEVLPEVPVKEVAYLSIDMNCAEPEIQALRYFWPRLAMGAVTLLDDYGFPAHESQKKAMNELAKELAFQILPLPSGQAVIIKA